MRRDMDDPGLSELAADDPEEVLIAISIKLEEMHGTYGIDELLRLSKTVAEANGPNVLGLMQEHPDLSSDLFGIDAASISDDLVGQFDEM